MPDLSSDSKKEVRSLSVVIPARDEEECIASTLSDIVGALRRAAIPYEVIVVDDGSTDQTAVLVSQFGGLDPAVRLIRNRGRHGFGMATRAGLDVASGDAVAVMMADESDSPSDLVEYFRVLQQGYDCAFGSRFISGSNVIDYPSHKLFMNRTANFFIRVLFGLPYNDVTNAFKCYRREVINAMQPLISPHFNLTVEMPLKAIIRGYSYKITPISWTNRKSGVSKLKLKEMGSRYLFIVLYLWLEKYLSHGDYHRSNLRHEAQPSSTTLKHV